MDLAKFFTDVFNTALVMIVCCFSSIYNFFFPTKKSIKNQIALVTGSGSGLGRGLALKLSELGCTIVLVDINQRTNNETGKLIRDQGGNCILYSCDLSDRNEIAILVDKVKKEVGDIEILINNAGIVNAKFLDELAEDEIQKSFDINIMAHFWLTKHFLPGMMHLNHGHIVNIASVAGFFGINKMSDYCASKFAVVGFTECLKEELRARNYSGVKTTCVCPYFIETGMFDGYQIKYDFLLKGLKTQEVVDSIVEAILRNQELLVLPWRLNAVIAIKNFLPIKAIEAVSDLLGVNGCLRNIHGKK